MFSLLLTLYQPQSLAHTQHQSAAVTTSSCSHIHVEQLTHTSSCCYNSSSRRQFQSAVLTIPAAAVNVSQPHSPRSAAAIYTSSNCCYYYQLLKQPQLRQTSVSCSRCFSSCCHNPADLRQLLSHTSSCPHILAAAVDFNQLLSYSRLATALTIPAAAVNFSQLLLNFVELV